MRSRPRTFVAKLPTLSLAFQKMQRVSRDEAGGAGSSWDGVSGVSKDLGGASSNGASGSWPHLAYSFLQPDRIRDVELRRPDDEDFDIGTVHVPRDFLDRQTPTMRQWWVLKSTNFDAVLFFKVGMRYMLYHADAEIGVSELKLAYEMGEFAECGFPEGAYGRFSAALIEKGYKVARVEETEDDEAMRVRTASAQSKFDRVVAREICQISTKGTRIYTSRDGDASSSAAAYLLAIVEEPSLGLPLYGVCFVDTSLGEINLGHFRDEECIPRLSSLLTQCPPAHVVYERGGLSKNTLKLINNFCPGVLVDGLRRDPQIWSASAVLTYLRGGGYFARGAPFAWPRGLEPYLTTGEIAFSHGRSVGGECGTDADAASADGSSATTADGGKELAVKALAGCVFLLRKYRIDHQLLTRGRFKTYTPPGGAADEADFARDMLLDAATMHNLGVLNGANSLVRTLNRCHTAFGDRLLRDWICRPSCSRGVISERQEAIDEILDNPEVIVDARGVLGGLRDLERSLSTIHARVSVAKARDHPEGRAALLNRDDYSRKEVKDFADTLKGFRRILMLFELFRDFKNPLIKRCTGLQPDGYLTAFQDTLERIENTFDRGTAIREGIVALKPGVDGEYDAASRELASVGVDSAGYLERQKMLFGKEVEYAGTGRNRFQIEVPNSRTANVGREYELQGSANGCKRYHTAELRDFLRRQIAAEERRDRASSNKLREMIDMFSELYAEWSRAISGAAVLDCLVSLVTCAFARGARVPEIHYDEDSGKGIYIEIRNSRYPGSDDSRPEDIIVGTEGEATLTMPKDPDAERRSTLMRQAGLIAIMAQIGCHVPATTCRITVVDRIIARLGDDIGRGALPLESDDPAAIFDQATRFSLVLTDEFGRGASTDDWLAVAASLLRALMQRQCRGLVSSRHRSFVE